MDIGDRIGNIRIEKRLGEGGMGEVFEAFDERLLRRVAVKTLNPQAFESPDSRARFLLEAQLLSKLDHPNICRIYGIEETPDGDLLVLELIKGQTLSEQIATDLRLDDKLRFARGIAEALDAAHQEGIIHRDLKPDNVMVIDGGQVKVLDFGIARKMDGPKDSLETTQGPIPASDPPSSTAPTEVIHRPTAINTLKTTPQNDLPTSKPCLTDQGSLIGTPAYMSPEQARGDTLTQASDMFSLGILLQELFTGSSAYEPAPTPVARIFQVAEGDSKPVEGVDRIIVRLIQDLKRLDPGERPTARETIERLDWILQGPARAARRKWRILGAVAVLVLMASTAWISLRMARPKPLLLPDQKGRVLVLPFINDTGDPANDWVRFGLMELVAQTLDASDGISVVSPTESAKALESRGLNPDRELPVEEVLQILDSAGAEMGLAVRIETDAGGFSFRYSTINVVGSVGYHSLKTAEPSAGANTLARRIAHRLRPESPVVEVFDQFSDQPLVNKIFAMGVESLHGAGATAARPYFEVALDRDPQLQWARIKLAKTLGILGAGAEAKASALEVLEAARSTNRPDLERAALLQLAVLMRRTGEYKPAREFFEQVLELAKKQGDRSGIADAVKGLGAIAYYEGDLTAARDLFKQSLALYRELGDRTGEMHSIGNLSAVASISGDIESSEVLDTEALEIARATGNLKGIADYLNNLGVSARYQDDFARAEDLYRESLELQRRLGNRLGEANTLHNLGDMAKEQGRLVESADFSRQALAIFEELGDPVGVGRASANLAETLLLQGATDEAGIHVEKTLNWDPNSLVAVSLKALLAYRELDFTKALRIQRQAKKEAEEEWRPIQQARLDAFVEAKRLGHSVPLPLEEKSPSQPADERDSGFTQE